MEAYTQAAEEARMDQPRTPPKTLRLYASLRGTFIFLGVLAVLVLALPTFTGNYVVGLVTMMIVWSIVNMAWNLLLGYSGVAAYGPLAFFAIGGYTAAFLDLYTSVPTLASLPIAAVVGGLAGLALGLPSLRLYGPYMVLFTLAFQLVIGGIVTTNPGDLTGGALGLRGLSSFELLGLETRTATLYIGLLLFVLVYLGIALLLRSPIGVALQAVRDSREAAEAKGINLFRHRLVLFAASSLITALSGAYYAHYVESAVPTMLSLNLLLSLLAMLMLGGLGTKLGPFVGTCVLVYLNDQLATAAQYREIIWGVLIVVIALAFSGGIVGTSGRLIKRGRSFVSAWVNEAPSETRMTEDVGPDLLKE